MDKKIVSIVRGEDIRKMVEECVKLLGGIGSIVKKQDNVLVHPCLVAAITSEHGRTTNPKVVEAIVEICKEAGAKQVIIAEGSGGVDTYHAFKVCGYVEVAERTGSKLVDLNTAETKEVNIPGGKVLKKISVPKVVLESDVLISVPNLHLHDRSRPEYKTKKWGSASVKSLMGLLPGRVTPPYRWVPDGSGHIVQMAKGIRPTGEKLKVHASGLYEAIVDLNLAIKPKLTILDAIVAGYGRIINGSLVLMPVKMNTLFSSKDPFALDTVAIRMNGWEVSDISYLRCAAERGICTFDIEKITIKGLSIEEIVQEWSNKISCISWEKGGLKVNLKKLYGRNRS